MHPTIPSQLTPMVQAYGIHFAGLNANTCVKEYISISAHKNSTSSYFVQHVQYTVMRNININ